MKKAIEYYEMYHEELYNPDLTWEERTDLGKKVFLDFCADSQELLKKRHMSTDSAVPALIGELNDKWNALVRIFEKKKGFSVLLKDGFKHFWEQDLKIKIGY